jgi:hypothetical protein
MMPGYGSNRKCHGVEWPMLMTLTTRAMQSCQSEEGYQELHPCTFDKVFLQVIISMPNLLKESG